MGVTDSKKAKQKETSHEVFPRGAVAIGLAAVVVGCRESRSAGRGLQPGPGQGHGATAHGHGKGRVTLLLTRASRNSQTFFLVP